MSAVINITKRKTIVKFSEGQHEKSLIFQILQKRTQVSFLARHARARKRVTIRPAWPFLSTRGSLSRFIPE